MEKPKSCISISDLTDDLLMEILVRVPCKSVFQCKCVSKRWFALISNPNFICSFLRHYKSTRKWWMNKFRPNLLSKQVLVISRRILDFPLTPSFLPCFQTSQEEEEACVVGFSKGLLVCCSTRDNQKIYNVCNPITKHWAVLPPNPSSREQQEVCVGFNCTRSYHNSECRYEVVLLTEFLGSKSQIKVETFSSVTGQWTKFVVSCPHNIKINLCGHAITYKGNLYCLMPTDNKILVYLPVHHKVHAIFDCPKEADPLLGSQCFDTCLGRLRIAQLRRVDNQCSLSMWRLHNNTGKWCLDRRINLKEITWKYKLQPPESQKIKFLQKANVLALDPGNADVVLLGLSNHIVAINLQTKALHFASKPPFELPCQALRITLPVWPTPVPALLHDALPRSKREADGTEVEDGEPKRAKVMPAAVWE